MKVRFYQLQLETTPTAKITEEKLKKYEVKMKVILEVESDFTHKLTDSEVLYLLEEDIQDAGWNVISKKKYEHPNAFADVSGRAKCNHKKTNLNYISWHEFAEEQNKKGIKQTQCNNCGLWLFPSEQ